MGKKLEKQCPFEVALVKLSEWTHNRGWDVDFDYFHYDEMLESTKTITITTRQGIEKQVFSFLHECGHVLIRANDNNFKRRYPAQARVESQGRNRQLEGTNEYKVDIIAEEIEAWERGLKLAKRLKIKIDEKRYRKYASDMVMTYVKDAARSGRLRR